MSTDPVITDLIEEFEFLDDWEDRYRHVIELGGQLPPLSDNERNAQTKVKGCVSQVWLVKDTATDGNLAFRADSDAHIVRGLAAILVRIYSGRAPQDILAIDAKTVLGQLGLAEHLSPQRSNGLFAMVDRIRREAAAA